MLRKVVAYNKREHENVKNEHLVMIWNCYHFYKHNIKFTRNYNTFKNSYLFKNDEQKLSCNRTTTSIYYNKLPKKRFKIHSYEIENWGKWHVQSFSKVIVLAHYISFT